MEVITIEATEVNEMNGFLLKNVSPLNYTDFVRKIRVSNTIGNKNKRREEYF